MARPPQGPPDGYTERAIGGTWIVARNDCHDAIRDSLGFGTLHAWASVQAGAVPLKGRDVAWATRLPNGREVVVRHSRHGGMLAGLTRDLFLAPSRAPEELRISHQLREAGVATPEVVAVAVYSAFGPLCRADVVTERMDAVDLPNALARHTEPRERTEILAAVARLLDSLRSAGATHPDLNARNILIGSSEAGFDAQVIDVDRVHFTRLGASVGRANRERLERSLEKIFGSQAPKIPGASEQA